MTEKDQLARREYQVEERAKGSLTSIMEQTHRELHSRDPMLTRLLDHSPETKVMSQDSTTGMEDP
jgi:hypothetical protein